jgi:hypothetical protein
VILLIIGIIVVGWCLIQGAALLLAMLLRIQERRGVIKFDYEGLQEPESHVKLKEREVFDWEKDN